MFPIVVPGGEFYNSEENKFFEIKDQKLVLEHSLVSISKWERKYHRPFLSDNGPRTNKEWQDYVECMTITQNVNPLVYKRLTKENYDTIYKYIDDPMTASWINEPQGPINREIITAEIVYYWMIELGIPEKFEKWPFNSLIMLIRVVNAKRQPKKKRSAKDFASLNAARKKALNTRG